MSLHTVEEVAVMLGEGRGLLLAGDERLLSRLPRGRWAGGTIPYFMSAEGGVETSERIFVTELPPDFTHVEVRSYEPQRLHELPRDYPADGVSFIVLPAGGQAHSRFAREGGTWPRFFERPLVGWIAGTSLARVGVDRPRVFDGRTGQSSEDGAVVLHATLRPGVVARTDIINLFEPAPDSPVLCFEGDGFSAMHCKVDGVERRLVDVLAERHADPRWPLIADFNGARLNVSFQKVDPASGQVDFYAPVFAGVEYRLASPLSDYVGEFKAELARRKVKPLFGCNCVLNYVYAELAGHRTGDLTGPFTFGEVAWMLLNQTVVYVTLAGGSP